MKIPIAEKTLILNKKLLNEAAKLYPNVNAATDFYNMMIGALQSAGFEVRCANDFSSGKHEFAGFELSLFIEEEEWEETKARAERYFATKDMTEELK